VNEVYVRSTPKPMSTGHRSRSEELCPPFRKLIRIEVLLYHYGPTKNSTLPDVAHCLSWTFSGYWLGIHLVA
jgi:hypothetical protein